ncbi:helix-turn-helix transcriptional regulator [Actinoplanes palleronii]|uniref:Transcriptional regulator n=1 Tax=Actinoplanes palleronii TaxID=113570 RepID=A0ABQ4BRC8_9ACTN|nr:helix-turn-helix transcriptional regulator [Actinoplanes palleronii]GIE73197.1 transcriptional regulator [Actinoplanes palleronii]
MANRSEVRDFLTARRARITPEQAGLPAYGSRRVAGLRRGEVAVLAGVSVEYYTRLERGNLSGVSDSVLDALARALRLDDLERRHLYDLAHTPVARRPRRPAAPEVRPTVLRLLDAMTEVPAFVRNDRFEILAANPLGRALYAPIFASPHRPPSTARFIFLEPQATGFYPEWDRVARDAVGALRIAAGRHPDDDRLIRLIGELSTRSDAFRTWWAEQNVYRHGAGVKRFRHPEVGDLDLSHESMSLADTAGLTLVTYTADPNSPSADALRVLASWSATPATPSPAGQPGH